MKRLLMICSLACLALLTAPARARSIGSYSGCKVFSGSTYKACMDCLSGGNFFQSDSRTCGLPGAKKPSTPPPTRPVATPPPPPPPVPLPTIAPPSVPILPPPPPPPPPTPREDRAHVDTKGSSMCSTTGAGTGGDFASFGLVFAAAALALGRARGARSTP